MYENHESKKWRLHWWKYRIKIISWKETCILFWFLCCIPNVTSFWGRKLTVFIWDAAGTRGWLIFYLLQLKYLLVFHLIALKIILLLIKSCWLWSLWSVFYNR